MGTMSLYGGIANTTALTLSMWFQVPTGLNTTDNFLPLWEMGGIPPENLAGPPTYSMIILPYDGTQTPFLLPFWGAPTTRYVSVEPWTDSQGNRLYGPWDPNDPANASLNGTYGTSFMHFIDASGNLDPYPGSVGGYVIDVTSGALSLTGFYQYSYVAITGAANALRLQCLLRSPSEPFVYSTDGPNEVNRTQLSHIVNFTNPLSFTPITAGSWHHLMVAAQLNGNTILDQPETAPIKLHKLVMMLDGVVHTSNTYDSDSVPGQFTSFDTLLDDGVSPYRFIAAGPGSPGLMVQSAHLPRNPEANDSYVNNLMSDDYDRAGAGASFSGGVQSDKVRRYAHVQFWRNQFIDPRIAENFSKFVTITGNIGTPASVTAAANAFGTQTIYLRGKSSDATFFDNRGDGGVMSRVGTFSDFVPGPSYGG